MLAVYTAAYGAGVFRLLVRTAAFFMLAIYAAANLANVFQKVIIYIA